jgi:acyl-CoA thioesterase FadM
LAIATVCSTAAPSWRFAYNLGGTASFLNLPAGARTTTVESKTNFFSAIAVGDTAYAECTPLHRGRTTMVWQTKITRGDGKLAALVTQTQLVLQAGDARVSAVAGSGALTKPQGSGG